MSNVARLMLFLTVFSVASVLPADELTIQHRRPIAAVAMDDHHIYVANRRSGTISEIDVSMNQVVREFRIGQRLTDLKRISADRLACIDEGQHELILLRRSANGLDIESRTPVSPYPVSLQVDLEQNRISVASLWARSLTIFDIANTVRPPTTIATIRLSFAPGQHLLLPKYDKAVVADAFGGKLAVVDLKSFQVESVRELPAHNIRHLTYQSAAAGDNGTRKPERIVLAHQFGNHLSRPTQDDIHWGMFLNNGLRTLQLNVVLDPRARLLSKSRFEALGGDLEERIQSEEYLALVRRGFRDWDQADTQEKRDLIQKLLTNAGASRLCPDDLIRLFLDWIDRYHEAHFLVIREIFRQPGCTRKDIWLAVHGVIPREDSAEADLFKLLIYDLSTGRVIRQHRPVDAFGNFQKKPTRRKSSGGRAMKSAFDDVEPYELTELGKRFIHYTMDDVVPRVGDNDSGESSVS
jgi:YVTN family beta-propeller protein